MSSFAFILTHFNWLFPTASDFHWKCSKKWIPISKFLVYSIGPIKFFPLSTLSIPRPFTRPLDFHMVKNVISSIQNRLAKKTPKSEMRGRKIMELSGKVEYYSNVHALAHNWKTLHSESKISYINFVGIICIFSSCLIGFFLPRFSRRSKHSVCCFFFFLY